MKIYTRTGDSGETGLGSGRRVSKKALRVEAYGEVDELNAVLGVARAHVSHPEFPSVLTEIQKDLFSVGTILSDPHDKLSGGKVNLEDAHVTRLERQIDRLESQLPQLRRFILPGGAAGSAFLHQARSVARRAERRLVALAEAEAVPGPVLAYLNRLSDLLFVMARAENQSQAIKDESW